jgi:signal-transduction protein with cAMP-binding, CBS, and nucleotidyltransferase domain
MRVDTTKIIMDKAYYLKKSILFDSYEVEELLDFTKQCRVVDYQIGETIMKEQSETNNLYIIAKGKIEVSRTNADSFLVPVQILREGSIFGIESMTKDAFSENKYIAYSDSVKLVEIPSTTLWNEVIKHPPVIQALVEYQCKQLDKFQSLWTMG